MAVCDVFHDSSSEVGSKKSTDYTLHVDPIHETGSMRARVEDGLGVGGLDGGGDVGNVVREEAAGGRAALAVSRVVGWAGEARLAREERDGRMCHGSPRCAVVLSFRKNLIRKQSERLGFVTTTIRLPKSAPRK